MSGPKLRMCNTRRNIILGLREKKCLVTPENVFLYLGSKFNFERLSHAELSKAKGSISRFCSEYQARMARCSRHLDTVFEKFAAWADGRVTLPDNCLNTASSCVGRPAKAFSECTVKAKMAKTDDLVRTRSSAELSFAATRALIMERRRDAEKVVNTDTAVCMPQEPATDSKKTSKEALPYDKISNDKALALAVDGNLGKRSYKRVRSVLRDAGCKSLPSYEGIQEAKLMCYPPPEKVVITERSGEIDLQALLDLTTRRLFESLREVINTLQTVTKFELHHKWGMDGSSDHAQFKKKSDENFSDSHMFLVTVVPLRLIAKTEAEKEIIVWNNSRPCSTRLSRPVKFSFEAEKKEVALRERDLMLNKIQNLTETNVGLAAVKHFLYMTMIDGKMCNFVTGTASSQVCNICGIMPSKMNNWEEVQRMEPKIEFYQLGISVLHTKIRAFECIKNIGCRLDFCQERVEDKSPNKLVYLAKHFVIQRGFHEKMGLHVDKPRSGGVGNSNDGNTARRAFENPGLFSLITGVNEELITQIATILEVVSCGYAIDVEAFKIFCIRTWKKYVELYSWYWMPPSIHKVLIHGSAIIDALPVPIGILSEEAQESRNKDLRNIRMYSTRKISWVSCHEDLMHALLITSDPVISSLREVPQKSTRNFSKDGLKLLKPPVV